MVRAGTAVLRGQCRPEESERAHLAEDRGIGLLVAESLEHPRRELALSVGARGIAHHAFLLGELRLEQQRIVPGELGLLGLGFERGVHAAVSVDDLEKNQASAVSNDTPSMARRFSHGLGR